jgi:hypothetical protein
MKNIQYILFKMNERFVKYKTFQMLQIVFSLNDQFNLIFLIKNILYFSFKI